ncbi:MAG: DUF4383 domain-containing protein [Deltaproteobacteria bacterium]|nr:DUF4383 domain-containing protein [Deltaproteobacteria bacterium]
MVRTFALVFGAVYLLVGLGGFVLASPILGIFAVNAPHNIVHIAVGLLWLSAALMAPMGPNSARTASKVIGIVYLLVAILGFAAPALVDSLLAINMADNLLHLGTAVLALYAGFMTPAEPATA